MGQWPFGDRNTGLSLDQTALEQAVRMAAGARLQTVRAEGETASIILEVSGLDRPARDALEAKVKEAACGAGADCQGAGGGVLGARRRLACVLALLAGGSGSGVLAGSGQCVVGRML